MVKVKHKLTQVNPNIMPKKNSGNIRGTGILEVLQLSIEKILPYENQARKIFDENELSGLVSSIKEVGIINPLLVTKAEQVGYFKVINGERRFRAAQEIGLEKIPCIILHDEANTELIAVIDNIQRVDLHPIELACAYESLISNYGDKKIISEKIGVSYTSFLETLKLTHLPQEIKEYLLNNNIRSRAIFRRLHKQKTLTDMQNILGIINSDNIRLIKKKVLECFIVEGKIELNILDKNIPEINKCYLENVLNEIFFKTP